MSFHLSLWGMIELFGLSVFYCRWDGVGGELLRVCSCLSVEGGVGVF